MLDKLLNMVYLKGKITNNTKQEELNMDYSKMTVDDFNETLSEILSGVKASTLLSIPGIFEILAEEYNNDVLDKWEENQTDDTDV